MLTPCKESNDQPRQQVKKQRHYFANYGPSSQGYGFSSGHVWMWELDCEETWVLKNWCFLNVVLEKTLESPLGCKEIQPVHSKRDQSWVFIGRTDAKAEHSENEDHGIQSHHFMGNRWGNSGNSVRLYIFGLQNHCRWWLQPWNLKMLTPWKESYDQPR